ncbi:MAG: pitrilysin family protein [Myxococcota bacterium]
MNPSTSAYPLALAAYLFTLGGCPAPEPTTPEPPTVADSPPEREVTEPVDRSKLPSPTAVAPWKLGAVQTWKMDNGIHVWLLEQTHAPLVSLQVLFPHGRASDPAKMAGLTALTVDLMNEGAGSRSALELSEAGQRLATDYGDAVGLDSTAFYINTLAENIAPSLELLADVLRRPRFPPAEFKRRKAQRLAQIEARTADPGTMHALAENEALFGIGYGGLPTSGTTATLRPISLDLVKRHYEALIQPEGATIVVVGAVDRAALTSQLNRVFGDWRGAPKGNVVGPKLELNEPGSTARIFVVDFPGAPQSVLSVARRVPGLKADDYFASRVFNWSLGGAFSSRLNLNLREDKGYTYGARAGFDRHHKAGSYSLKARVKADTTRPSLDEMFKEVRDMVGGRPLSEVEYKKAVDGLLLGFPGRFETMNGTAGQLGFVASAGWDAAWLGKWPDRIRGVSIEEARASAQANLSRPEDFVVVVAGDWSSLAESFSDLNREVVMCGKEPVFLCPSGNP